MVSQFGSLSCFEVGMHLDVLAELTCREIVVERTALVDLGQHELVASHVNLDRRNVIASENYLG